MLTDEQYETKEIFLDDPSKKEIFKTYHGYKVYWRCRFCGHWIFKRQYCNAFCQMEFKKLACRFPSHFIERPFSYPEYDPSVIKYGEAETQKIEDKMRKRLARELLNSEGLSLFRALKPEFKNQSMGLLNRLEKLAIRVIVKRHNYNLSFCSKILGITRHTLYDKLKRYNIPIERKPISDE
jgi:DNA-binding protein Fis